MRWQSNWRKRRQEEQDHTLLHHIDSPHAQKILRFGAARDLDVEELIAIQQMLNSDINLTHWRDSPEVKDAVRRAREAVAEAAGLAINRFWQA